MKLTDLKDLRVIKKSLEPEPEQKPQQNQPRKRSVELKSKEEEHARNEGLVMGQKVRMMDTNDTATIIGFGKGYYELELDGLPIRAVRSEFIPVDADEDRRQRIDAAFAFCRVGGRSGAVFGAVHFRVRRVGVFSGVA